MTFGSLFTGQGGMDLGLHRSGMECRWQVEIDPFCSRVLNKHWGAIPKHGDIRVINGSDLERVDLIAGGFPCQDISYAGFGAGIRGGRSGLWVEFARIIRELGPTFVLVENVSALLGRGLSDVLGTLADIGFDAEWSSISSCSMGATHVRRRVFIVAYSNRIVGSSRIRDSIARSFGALQAVDCFQSARASAKARMENPSELYRGADGVPYRLERNRGLGNAVDPVVAQWIGERIMAVHKASGVGV